MVSAVWLLAGCLVLSETEQEQGKSPPVAVKVQTVTHPPYSAEVAAQALAEAKTGDARHGAIVFQLPQFACISCHKIGKNGGSVGPDLTLVGRCLTPEQIVEAVLWPKRQVKDEYKAIQILTAAGKTYQGYKEAETDKELVLRDPANGTSVRLAKADIEERREVGTLMPDGLAFAMTPQQRRDLLRFLLDLGKTEGLADLSARHNHLVATFPVERAPLNPDQWPNWQHFVNRDRLYDFYARQADYFRKLPSVPPLLPEFPGIDGGKYGHWGNQNEDTWVDARWNKTQLGSVMCGAFHGAGATVPRGVCVRLGERGEMAACFNPDTLCYEAVWKGGFVKFSPVRHGFLHGLLLDGQPLPKPQGKKPDRPFVYRGFFRHGTRVIFAYCLDGVEMLDAPWVENGQFTRVVAPAARHPLAKLTRGGPAQWPRVLHTRGILGTGGPYVVDTIQPPFENPWQAPIFFGDHDFMPDGTALLCTIQGDVWRVDGLDHKLERVRWRRIASGLHQALGLIVAQGRIYVLGRDQLTRLHDRNGDGEIDYYECFSNRQECSPSGHDYICGLQRDAAGNFYTASSKQGLLRISADGQKVDVLATGFRNPDGLGLYPDGALTVPCSEGEWTPTSMICLVHPDGRGQGSGNRGQGSGSRGQGSGVRGQEIGVRGQEREETSKDKQSAIRNPQSAIRNLPHFGYGGLMNGRVPDLPLVYLPRGLDNSSGGQVYIASDRWGPLHGRMVHLSNGTGSHFLLLRDEVEGQPQGAVVPLAGEFWSGTHRGRFNPKDGQLYVSGMDGWGNYAMADGCFHRVRYTGQKVQLPSGVRVHHNGVLVTFTQPIDRSLAQQVKNHFAQAWNYRYSAAYGSPEFSPRHPGTRGHDHLPITAAHVLADGRSLFLVMPDLQPVNQLHLRLKVDAGSPQDLYLTVHRLGTPFTDIPNYQPIAKTIAAHPILADLRAQTPTAPNPWQTAIPQAKSITIDADQNLTYKQRSITVKAGQPVKLTFINPDAVPHNWVLVKPGSLQRIGEQVNRIIADPDAAARHYVPQTPDVLVYTDIVSPQSRFTIFFRAPTEKGRYPYMCSFPGHWMVMNGTMIVE